MTALYTIPAGEKFLNHIAQFLLQQCPAADLPKIHILLPTRRACRALRVAFLQETKGAAILLPRMSPVGDPDEDFLLSHFLTDAQINDFFDIPAAIHPIQRTILLAHLVRPYLKSLDENKNVSWDHALKMAHALGQFLDMIQNEGRSLDDLPNLVDDGFQEHWQITTEFLSILATHWPLILDAQNCIDPVQRRNLILEKMTQIWMQSDPSYTIIAAGLNGSIPAVRQLLSSMMKWKQPTQHPNHALILDGLDIQIDDQSWDFLDETHPQYALKTLLLDLKKSRHDFHLLPTVGAVQSKPDSHKHFFIREVMRPAQTTHIWQDIEIDPSAYESIHLLESDSPQQEADLIALLIREAIEKPHHTIMVVTPDRLLSRRIITQCQKWGLVIDDSSGMPLSDSPIFAYMRLIIQYCIHTKTCETFDFEPLVTLLKHPLCGIELSNIYTLEKRILRNQHKQLEFLKHKSQHDQDGKEQHPLCILKRITQDLIPQNDTTSTMMNMLDRVYISLQKISAMLQQGHFSFVEWLYALIETAESLSTNLDENPLWQGSDGQALSDLMHLILQYGHDMPPLSLAQFESCLLIFAASHNIRPLYGMHPRITILGTMEARLLSADTVILAGLNEGVWPNTNAHDPWMSRQMRLRYDLPSVDYPIGIAAHDFVSHVCAPHVFISRTRQDEEKPTVPSRWLLRMETVLQACKQSLQRPQHYFTYLNLLTQTQTIKPITAPYVTPPVAVRPTSLSVSAVETWLRDPYSIYAKYILGLRPLSDLQLSDGTENALRGTVIHQILHDFIDEHRTHPLDVEKQGDIVWQKLMQGLRDAGIEATKLHYESPRLKSTAKQFIADEIMRRENGYTPLFLEEKGSYTIQFPNQDPFILTTKIDRIDQDHENQFIIFDYKTGTLPKKNEVHSGYSPQLLLESLIVQNGSLQHPLPLHPIVAEISYISIKYNQNKFTAIKGDALQGLIDQTYLGLKNLILSYCKESTPYLATPDPEYAPQYNDYAHLSRYAEWGTENDEDSDYGT